jgi:hypothetical protein
MYQTIRTLARSTPLTVMGLAIGLSLFFSMGESKAAVHMDWQVVSTTAGGLQSSVSSGNGYKLFSVTGQPTPVGEATSSAHKLQSGYIPDFGGDGSCCTLAGNANGDDKVNIGDAVFIVNYIFRGGAPPSCLDQANANCDSAINIGDAVYLVNFLFRSGPAPCCP